MLGFVLSLAVLGWTPQEEDHSEEFVTLSHQQLVLWIAKNHKTLDYASKDHQRGGAALSLKLIEDLDKWFHPEPPPPDPGIPDATWTWDGKIFTRVADGAQFTGYEVEDWLGSDFWSTASRNNQPMPGKRPGDVLHVGPGTFKFGRWTLQYDLNMEAMLASRMNDSVPVGTRLGSAFTHSDRPFTYLDWADINGESVPYIRYGKNNRDIIKGAWTRPSQALFRFKDANDNWVVTTNPNATVDTQPLEPAYPAWFEWGYDPQTWIVGAVDDDGNPLTVFDHTYHEHVGACTERNLIFRSTGTSKGIWQTENPIPYDKDGNRILLNWPENMNAVAYEWQSWRDIDLGNVHVDGQWNPYTNTHPEGVGRSKWGVFTYRVGYSALGKDVPGFSFVKGYVGGIGWEHAFYLHNTRALTPEHFAFYAADLFIENCKRTAFQFTARTYTDESGKDGNPVVISPKAEGPPGQGKVLLERIKVRRVCLEGSGGGSAFSLNGNHKGEFILRDIDCWLGDPKLKTDSITGCLVVHSGGGSGEVPVEKVTVEDCWFRVGGVFPDGTTQSGKHAARRPNVNIQHVGTFTMRNTAIWQVDGAREAIEFHDEIDKLVLDPQCDVRGDIKFGEQVWRDEDADSSGWDDGKAWGAFIAELRDGVDTNGDGVLAAESGVVGEIVLED